MVVLGFLEELLVPVFDALVLKINGGIHVDGNKSYIIELDLSELVEPAGGRGRCFQRVVWLRRPKSLEVPGDARVQYVQSRPSLRLRKLVCIGMEEHELLGGCP